MAERYLSDALVPGSATLERTAACQEAYSFNEQISGITIAHIKSILLDQFGTLVRSQLTPVVESQMKQWRPDQDSIQEAMTTAATTEVATILADTV